MTTIEESIDETIAAALAAVFGCRRADGGTRVATHCLYPGGDCATVLVTGGPRAFVVSDDGAGWDALLAAAIDVAPSSHGRRAHTVADAIGVEWRHGSFLVDDVTPSQLAAAIVLVANASQRWVTEILSDRQVRAERRLRRLLTEQLRRLFADERVQARRIAGETTKPYDFANVVTLPNRLLIVEPVSNHANAIAGAFLKLTDVHKAHPDYPREVVIEDLEAWASADLAVLSEASDGIRDIAKGLDSLREKYAA